MSLLRHLIVIVASAVILSACDRSPCHVYRIGVSQCSSDDWRSKMNDEILREIMFHPEATVEIRSADGCNAKQIADLNYFRDNDFDIIICAPNEADSLTPVVREIYDSGTPVIIFDRNVNDHSYTAYQGADNSAIGRSAAHYAHHLAGDGAKVVEIHGLSGSTPARERHRGFVEGIAEEKGMTLLATAYGNWNAEGATLAAESLLRTHPDADVIYAHNDRMAIAARHVADCLGLTPYIIGVDAAPEIGIRAVADSVINATFLYPTEGHRLIRTALSILKGEPYDSLSLLPASSAVDFSNADILEQVNQSLVEETSKMQYLKSQVDDYWTRHSAQNTLIYVSVSFLILLLGFLFIVLKAYWCRQRQAKLLAEQRDRERRLNASLKEATQSKLAFFTNVSHDLRTPLTLIAEPVDQLREADNLTDRQRLLMRIAYKNVRILHRLINQILDFRKYENGKLELVRQEVDFASLAREWAESFETIARKRDITFGVDIPARGVDFHMAVDVEKIERVFFNLVSNAFRYTPDNGRITVSACCDGHILTFSVADTGQGIPPEDIDQIFERFFQVEKVRPKGSGIGLSLARAFVELHGGDIRVTSALGKGTTFTVELPVIHTDAHADLSTEKAIRQADVEAELDLPVSPTPQTEGEGKPLVLVIDDNRDILRMVAELLASDFEVITATNGLEGIARATRYVPDLIICDVMMPGMDGLACCRRLKEEVTTSHIPVLMLTACSMDEQRVEGYENGADGYVSKPFSAKVLMARCHNLIDNRRLIRNLWQNKSKAALKPAPAASPAPRPVGDIDSEFYTRFLELIRSDMANPDLNVDLLADRMGLGRSQLYRKIKALTNYSPVELLRRLRLDRAREMLTSSEKSISEIGYDTGFSSPAYFTRCFREAFGETPSDLRDRLGH